MASKLDRDGDGHISREEFDILISDPEMTSCFDELGCTHHSTLAVDSASKVGI